MVDAPALLTVGHGTAGQHELAALLDGAAVELVVDVRRYPASRRHPHVNRAELARWLARAGIDYRWCEALGGRRRAAVDSVHHALRAEGFRGYAEHMSTAAFAEAVDELVVEAARRQVALLCAEAWWVRCHRRLIADHLTLLDGATVHHLRHGGRLKPHVPTDGVRVDGGCLRYDRGQAPLDPDA